MNSIIVYMYFCDCSNRGIREVKRHPESKMFIRGCDFLEGLTHYDHSKNMYL